MGGEKVKLGKLRNSRLTKHTMDVSRKYIDLDNQSLSQRNLLNRIYSLTYDPLQAASFPFPIITKKSVLKLEVTLH